MRLALDEPEARAVLGAMRAIGRAHHGELTDVDRETIDVAAQIFLAHPELGADAVEDREPEQIAPLFTDPERAKLALRMLAVMSLVDGAIDPEKNARVDAYASALGVEEDYLAILNAAAAGEIGAATACIVRKNAESFPHLEIANIDVDAAAPFLPYRDGNEDRGLEARYAALGELPPETFGRAFWDHFHRNGFAFPGNPAGLAEGFTTPHDSSHVLSGYSTSEQGELCVSTFIGAMHPDHPMAAEVLPVLFSWHLGVKLNEIAGAATGAYDPARFWTAWERGAATTVDIVSADWDFWGVTEVPLEELRRNYGVPPAGAELLA